MVKHRLLPLVWQQAWTSNLTDKLTPSAHNRDLLKWAYHTSMCKQEQADIWKSEATDALFMIHTEKYLGCERKGFKRVTQSKQQPHTE